MWMLKPKMDSILGYLYFVALNNRLVLNYGYGYERKKKMLTLTSFAELF